VPANHVSIIIPVYNRPDYVLTAVESALAQREVDVQVIVVDDGSTVDVLRPLQHLGGRVQLLRKPNGGPASARNFAAMHADGEFLIFLDDDDYLEPDCASRLVSLLGRVEGAQWAAGRFNYVDGSGRRVQRDHNCPRWDGDVARQMIKHNLVGPPCTVLVTAAAFRQVGGFDESRSVQTAEDYDLWLSVSFFSPVAFTDEKVANYRIHGAQSTVAGAKHAKALMTVIEKQRRIAPPAFETEFADAIERLRLSYGDQLYCAGLFAEARAQWKAVLAVHGSGSAGLRSRILKSYLPRPAVASLRKLASAWRAR
jgi:glycosyltransferase involved in cell wall biosynthesis